MNRIVLVLTLLATVISILGCGTKAKREKPFSMSEECPDIKIDCGLSLKDANYLGVSGDKSFSLKGISADLLVLECRNRISQLIRLAADHSQRRFPHDCFQLEAVDKCP